MMKWLDRSLVQSPLCYGICFTEADFHKECARLKLKPGEWPAFLSADANATVHHFLTTDEADECCIVCIKKVKLPVHQIAALLAHEAVHIWQLIKRNIGEDEPSDEFEAYAVQSITHNLIQAYYDKGKKK